MMWNKLLACLFIFLLGCDFTSPIHREILSAQDLIGQQEYKKAAIIYESILDHAAGEVLRTKIFFQLGLLYSIYLGEPEKGKNYFRLILKETSDPLWLVKVQEKLGEVNFSYLKNFKDASVNYKRLVEFTPRLENVDFYQFREALSYYYGDELNKSAEVCLQIVRQPHHKYYGDVYYYLGMIHFKQKKWHKALAYWKSYLQIEKRKDQIVQAKFLIANTYETLENLKEAYNIYYSILGDYPNPEVIRSRLKSLYDRRVARKR